MTTARERILQKLNPKLLNMTPKLSVENGSFINLDSDDSLEDGAKQLMMRFWRNQDLCEKNKRNTSQNEMEVTVTRAKYNEGDEICDILTEKLNLPCSKNEDDYLCDKPGKNLQKLQMQLQEKMAAKWEEEYKKRVNENKLNKEYKESKHKKCVDDEENSDEEFDPNECSEDDEDKQESDEGDGCEGDVEDEEEEVENTMRNALANEVDDEPCAEESPTENLSKGMGFEDTGSCSLPPAYQPGGGLLYGGSELTQCDEDLPQNLLSPSLKLSAPESPQCKSLNDSTPNGKEMFGTGELNNSFLVRNKLFSQNPNEFFDLNDAYEFCSGKFPDESSNSQLKAEQLINHASDSANFEDEEETDENEDEEELNKNEDEANENKDEISDACDKTEDEEDGKSINGPKVRKNVFMFDDSEDEEERSQPEVEESKEASKILSDCEEEGDDKIKKRRKNLQFSDEEEDGDEEEDDDGEEKERDSEKEEGEEMDEKDEERSVHYDSEENEIINPREFFEKEAELSGSERSEDEDERGLDEFDVEEGDADNLDNDQVRSQLEKIHLRRVLDDDAREVRLIQEILFEDGDLYSDGKGRDRKFKWKNLSGTFEENEETETKEEGENSSEDEEAEEEQQRKLRHEKELFLMEKKRNGDVDSGDEIIEDFHSIKVTSVKSSIKTSGTENSKSVLDYTGIGKQVTLSKARGSFLTRNEEFLSRLAKVTSGISDNVLGPKHSKNFVFATKSPEKVEPNKSTGCKRQVNDADICGRRHEKKFKILPPDVDTGPSILDLLV